MRMHASKSTLYLSMRLFVLNVGASTFLSLNKTVRTIIKSIMLMRS